MKIIKTSIDSKKRRVSFHFDSGDYIYYTKFGKDLFTGDMHSEGLDKRAKLFTSIKQQLKTTDYFKNKEREISLDEWVEMRDFMENLTQKINNREYLK